MDTLESKFRPCRTLLLRIRNILLPTAMVAHKQKSSVMQYIDAWNRLELLSRNGLVSNKNTEIPGIADIHLHF